MSKHKITKTNSLHTTNEKEKSFLIFLKLDNGLQKKEFYMNRIPKGIKLEKYLQNGIEQNLCIKVHMNCCFG